MLPYVVIHLDWEEATQTLKPQEKGRLIDALVAYAKGEDPMSKMSGNEKIVFPVFKTQLDRDIAEEAKKRQARAEVARENGKKGGRPPVAQNPENPENPLGFSVSGKESSPHTPFKESNTPPPPQTTTPTKNNTTTSTVVYNERSRNPVRTTRAREESAFYSDRPMTNATNVQSRAWAYFCNSVYGRPAPAAIWHEMFPYLQHFSQNGKSPELNQNADDVVIMACEQAQIYANNKASWAYVRRVLDTWKAKGLLMAEEVKASEVEHEQAAQNKAKADAADKNYVPWEAGTVRNYRSGT